jgi:hypothetical protein
MVCAGLLQGASSADPLADFERRASHPDVVRAISFDGPSDVTTYVLADGKFESSGSGWDQSVKSSGAGSLRFTIPSNSNAGDSGSWRINFSDPPYATQFGENEEFYVQWRQRFDRGLLTTSYDGGGGWKQLIIGEGDMAGEPEAGSCSELEIVVQNTGQRGFPQLYHSCGSYTAFEQRHGSYDFRLQNGIRSCLYSNNPTGQVVGHPPCFIYVADEWLTYQVHVKLGPRGTATSSLDGPGVQGFTESVVQMWGAREGQPSRLLHDWSGLVLRETAGKEYGKVWLLPYHTGKSSSQSHPVTYTWYDELIISRSRISDPEPRT